MAEKTRLCRVVRKKKFVPCVFECAGATFWQGEPPFGEYGHAGRRGLQ